MTILHLLAAAGVMVIFLASTWDEPNRWKVVGLGMILVVSVLTLRLISYDNGYEKGSEDALCTVYERVLTLDNSDADTIDFRKPEFC
jgi:hypothetical protein